MYNINFYKDEKGNEPVKDYIVSLKAKGTKDSIEFIRENIKSCTNEVR